MDIGFDLGEEDPIKEILLRYNNIVFVGCSGDPKKDAYEVPRFMLEQGYSITCVNPNAKSILGVPTYKRIEDVPSECMEILVVFRPPGEIPSIVDTLLGCNKLPHVFWMQEGIRSSYAREKLAPLGVIVLEDRCIKKEYMRVFTNKDSVYEEILKFARNYARRAGYVLNPDPKKLDGIISGLAYNQKKYGFRYCPCRQITGDKEEDAKKICPCFWHRDEIRTMGHCHCGLFWDPAAVERVIKE